MAWISQLNSDFCFNLTPNNQLQLTFVWKLLLYIASVTNINFYQNSHETVSISFEVVSMANSTSVKEASTKVIAAGRLVTDLHHTHTHSHISVFSLQACVLSTSTHTLTHSHSNTHTHTHADIHSCVLSTSMCSFYKHTYAYSHSHSNTNTHTHTHTVITCLRASICRPEVTQAVTCSTALMVSGKDKWAWLLGREGWERWVVCGEAGWAAWDRGQKFHPSVNQINWVTHGINQPIKIPPISQSNQLSDTWHRPTNEHNPVQPLVSQVRCSVKLARVIKQCAPSID